MIKQFCSLVLFTALISTVGFSQSGKKGRSNNHERMKAKKIAYITDELDLTSSESEKFWPIYNEMKKEFDVLNDGRRLHEKQTDLSESEAKAMLTRSIERDKKEIALKEKYNTKFLEAISAQKLVKLRGVERKFRKEMLSSIRDRFKSRKG